MIFQFFNQYSLYSKIKLKYYQQKIKKFKNIHKNQRCFIMGNGPSLNKINLDFLKNEITICCNMIFLKKSLFPKFYCIEDELLLKHIAKDLKESWLSDNTIKFIPLTLSSYVKGIKKVFFVNFKYNRYKEEGPLFSENFSKICYWGSTVTYMMLQLAYYLGCNPIYLIGMDGVRLGKPKHFYPKNKIPENPPVYKLSNVSLKKAKEFLKNKGIEVYNATKNPVRSFFKTINYKKIFI